MVENQLDYPPELIAFQHESNRIEGIVGVSGRQIEALQTLLASRYIAIGDLVAYVKVIQPNAQLRSTPNIPGVRVANHIAPPSGPKLLDALSSLLLKANHAGTNAF